MRTKLFYFCLLLVASPALANCLDAWELPLLETKRLIVRQTQDRDFEELKNILLNPVNQALSGDHYEVEDVRATTHVPSIAETHDDWKTLNYTILDALTKQVIGLVSLKRWDHHPDSVYRGVAILSYSLDTRYWRQGLIYEAVTQLIPYWKKNLNLKLLKAMTLPSNVRSRNTLRRLGFSEPNDLNRHTVVYLEL